MQSAATIPRNHARFDQDGVENAADSAAVFEVLANAGCRAILRAIGEDTLSASEIGERVDAPMSSIYRQLDALTGSGFLLESVRINTRGRNENEYTRCVADLSISIAEDFDVAFA